MISLIIITIIIIIIIIIIVSIIIIIIVIIYYRLSTYYSKSIKSRSQAFKYKLKSADQSISKGAYAVGLLFLKEAYQLTSSGDNDHDDECEIMLKVCAVALEDLRGKLIAIKSASVSYLDERYDKDDDNNHRDASGYDEAYLNDQYKQYSSLHLDLLKHFKHNRQVDTVTVLDWQPSYALTRKPFESKGLAVKSLKDHKIGKGSCCTIA